MVRQRSWSFLPKSQFRHGDRELLDFACPARRALAVVPLKYQRESADAVEQAPHRNGAQILRADALCQKVPKRQGDGVTQRLIARAVAGLSQFAFAVLPLADVRPVVWKLSNIHNY